MPPIKDKIKKIDRKIKSSIPKKKTLSKKRKHKEYGTSKLEERFAHEFLDKLGIEYVYQWKAESIGRYFDFRIRPDLHGPIIEIQGSYWHGDPRLYEEKDLNKTQKRDIKIDEIKRKWCSRNGVKLIYIWEKDINESPSKVINFLKEELKHYLGGVIKNKRK